MAALKAYKQVPKEIWVLSLGNLLINVSAIISFSFTPFFLIAVFGVSRLNFGIIEGIVEGTSWVIRIVSGALSDIFRRRKILILIGYTLLTLSRPLFVFASSVLWVFSGRMIDRIANGLQAPPREALTADYAPPNIRGLCFGIRQACGWIGSVIGAFVGIIAMKLTGDNYRLVFLISAIPAILAVLIVALFVKDSFHAHNQEGKLSFEHQFHIFELKKLPQSYWILTAVSSIYMLARFSESFITLRAESLGLEKAYIPIVIAIINLASAFAAYPAGFFSDKIDRRLFVGLGLFMVIVSDIILALSSSVTGVLIGSLTWGLQVGLTQSLFVTMVADRAPKNLRGTAFGIYFLMSGLSMFAASAIAGWCSHYVGHHAPFYCGFIFSCLAAFGLFFVSSSRKGSKQSKT
ncbi:MAG: MFS transporter [Alphaproteobacteria bacterium]|nr:MFS transporter [Alphaproteobacteria bacterium]OJV46951.1 MAG: hypothetical protein BGO28_06380 [Alphaproteobacteria bacterium 43-37]